jgi:hypothetical protein
VTPLDSDKGDGQLNTKRRARGAQKGNVNAQRHGLFSLQRRLKGAGITKNDGRSALERLKSSWKEEIRAARGGDLSPQQEVLLELAANTWLMASSADDYILERGVVNRRKGTLRPIVEQRAKLARTLRELLGDIGLDRALRHVHLTLADVIASYATEAREDEVVETGADPSAGS